jgi:hypothetical protein
VAEVIVDNGGFHAFPLPIAPGLRRHGNRVQEDEKLRGCGIFFGKCLLDSEEWINCFL